MCSMFCVLHVLVWNETSQMLTCFPNESQLRAPQHMQHYRHTRVCALWGETLRKLKLCDFWWMDWWKMKVLLFFSSSHLTHKSTHHVSPLLILFHITQTRTFTDSPELITLLCAVRGGGRWWQLNRPETFSMMWFRWASIHPTDHIHRSIILLNLSTGYAGQKNEDNGVIMWYDLGIWTVFFSCEMWALPCFSIFIYPPCNTKKNSHVPYFSVKISSGT